MPTLAVTNFNVVCSVLGGFITLFGLVSYLFKEKFYLSEARMYFKVSEQVKFCVEANELLLVISLVAGVIFSPHATNLIRPLEYAGSEVGRPNICYASVGLNC
jgi:sodium/hydrogen antiporter